jgi:hypothetical protein
MNVVKRLDATDVEEIYRKIGMRQSMFDETFVMSLGVVLMNLGDSFVQVECVGGEWSGTKGDLAAQTIFPKGIPLCPLKHPLIEITRAPILALVEVED